MTFCCTEYIFFLAITVVIYYAIPQKGKKYILLAASIFFYMTYDVRVFLFVIFSCVSVYGGARILEICSSAKMKKGVLVLVLTLNLLILILLKYNSFIGQFAVFNRLTTVVEKGMDKYSIILPLGISFYTLSVIGYLIDVYRNNIKAETNVLEFMLFVTFFPHILQGPIARYGELAPQFNKIHKFEWNSFCSAMQLMIWGYIKKLIIADTSARMVDSIYGKYMLVGGTELLIASLLYTVQIYSDFSGCMDISLGSAKLFGIDLTQNFMEPYLATSIQDFWRRWHISLSSWFRDYIYIPLGGGRKGVLHRWRNVVIVFLVSGIWHGASWNFVLWGLLHSIYQIVGYCTKPIRLGLKKLLQVDINRKYNKLLQILSTFSLVNITWVFFKVGEIKTGLYIVKKIFCNPSLYVLWDSSLTRYGISYREMNVLLFFILLLALVDYLNYKGICVRNVIARQHLFLRWFIYLMGISAIALFGAYGVGYNAADFIYMNF